MPLTDSKTLVQHAFANGYAVAQVNTNGATYEITRAIVDVAEQLQAPIILGAYETNIEYRGMEYTGMELGWFANKSKAPVAVHLDHGHSVESCKRAIDAGFTSVMIDGSTLPIEKNIEQTKEVVKAAKAQGATVEAEIGELQVLNPDGSMNEVKNLSDPQEAQMISEQTGIDMLAVGIGNAHGFYKGQPNIRFDILEKIRKATNIPLVLHGSTGLSEDTVRKCVSMGMAKVNLGTLVRTRCVEYTSEVIAANNHKGHQWRIAKDVCEKLKQHVRDIIRLTGSEGKG